MPGNTPSTTQYKSLYEKDLRSPEISGANIMAKEVAEAQKTLADAKADPEKITAAVEILKQAAEFIPEDVKNAINILNEAHLYSEETAAVETLRNPANFSDQQVDQATKILENAQNTSAKRDLQAIIKAVEICEKAARFVAVKVNDTQRAFGDIKPYTKILYDFDYIIKNNAGNAHAMLALGWCYFEGRGVEHNTISAYSWMNRAAQKGVYLYYGEYDDVKKTGALIEERALKQAQHVLADEKSQFEDKQTAFDSLRHVAIAGNGRAMLDLSCYLRQQAKITTNEEKAKALAVEADKWLERAAHAGVYLAVKSMGRNQRGVVIRKYYDRDYGNERFWDTVLPDSSWQKRELELLMAIPESQRHGADITKAIELLVYNIFYKIPYGKQFTPVINELAEGRLLSVLTGNNSQYVTVYDRPTVDTKSATKYSTAIITTAKDSKIYSHTTLTPDLVKGGYRSYRSIITAAPCANNAKLAMLLFNSSNITFGMLDIASGALIHAQEEKQLNTKAMREGSTGQGPPCQMAQHLLPLPNGRFAVVRADEKNQSTLSIWQYHAPNPLVELAKRFFPLMPFARIMQIIAIAMFKDPAEKSFEYRRFLESISDYIRSLQNFYQTNKDTEVFQQYITQQRPVYVGNAQLQHISDYPLPASTYEDISIIRLRYGFILAINEKALTGARISIFHPYTGELMESFAGYGKAESLPNGGFIIYFRDHAAIDWRNAREEFKAFAPRPYIAALTEVLNGIRSELIAPYLQSVVPLNLLITEYVGEEEIITEHMEACINLATEHDINKQYAEAGVSLICTAVARSSVRALVAHTKSGGAVISAPALPPVATASAAVDIKSAPTPTPTPS